MNPGRGFEQLEMFGKDPLHPSEGEQPLCWKVMVAEGEAFNVGGARIKVTRIRRGPDVGDFLVHVTEAQP